MRTPMKTKERTIWIMAPVLAISIGFLVPNATAQSNPYPKMAPIDQYLMTDQRCGNSLARMRYRTPLHAMPRCRFLTSWFRNSGESKNVFRVYRARGVDFRGRS